MESNAFNMSGTENSETRSSEPRLSASENIGKHLTWQATAQTVLLVFLLPTLVYMFLASRFGFHGPRMNADLLLLAILGALFARIARRTATALLVAGIAAVLAIQLGVGLGAIYLDDPALIREYLGFIGFWPWREIGTWTAIAAVAFFILYFVLRKVDLPKVRILPIAILLLALSALDIWGDTETGYRYIGDNVLTSSGIRLIQLGQKWATSPGFISEPLAEPMMAHKILAQDPLPERLLSVSVEAFGLAKNQPFNDAIVAPMEAILSGHYSIEYGKHAATGGTLSGEFRELCNLKTAGTPTATIANDLSANCLPKALVSRRYQTLGIHGNARLFYNRHEVYPALGFTSTLFSDNFAEGNRLAPRCKTRAFDGICDSAAFAAALEFVGARPQSYAHIMTLDTHFPLGVTPLGDNSCNRVLGLKNPALCLYANQMANLLAELARQLVAAEHAPDEVYIFGDHSPPYATVAERTYFKEDAVPFIVLRKN